MLKLWDITKGMTLQSNKGEIGVVSEVNEKVFVTLDNGEGRKIGEGSLKNWKLVISETPTSIPKGMPQVKGQNAEVQLHQQTEENAAGGEIVDTNKLETNKKKQIEPSIQKMFDEIIDHMVDKGCNIKRTPAYIGLKCSKHNIAEVYLQKKGIRLHLNSKSLSTENINMCKIVPDTYGWTLDSIYKVTNKEQYEKAIEMLEQGFKFRYMKSE